MFSAISLFIARSHANHERGDRLKDLNKKIKAYKGPNQIDNLISLARLATEISANIYIHVH